MSDKLGEVGLPSRVDDRHSRIGGFAAIEAALSRPHLLPARCFHVRAGAQAMGSADPVAGLAWASQGARSLIRGRYRCGVDRIHARRADSMVDQAEVPDLLFRN